MNCDKCVFYVDRPKTPQEIQYQQSHGVPIDTRICSLNGCDGSRFVDRERSRNNEYGRYSIVLISQQKSRISQGLVKAESTEMRTDVWIVHLMCMVALLQTETIFQQIGEQVN